VSEDPGLYAVYLGGDPAPGRLSEDHEVVLVVAGDLAEARRRARAKWGGATRPHVDAVLRVDVVDGFAVTLDRTDRHESTEVDLTYEPADETPGAP
jgi:hypothetical protein